MLCYRVPFTDKTYNSNNNNNNKKEEEEEEVMLETQPILQQDAYKLT